MSQGPKRTPDRRGEGDRRRGGQGRKGHGQQQQRDDSRRNPRKGGAPGARDGRARPPGGQLGRGQRPFPFLVKGELLFGRNAILEALRAARRAPTRLWVAEGLRQDDRVDEIVELARRAEVLVETVPRSMLDDAAPDVNHQGVLLESPEYPYVDLADVVEAEGNVLILDHLQDPQNVGTLLRAAEAAGTAGVIIPSDRSAGVSPAVVNASAGAVEHLQIAQVPNLGNAIEKLDASGRWIVGLDGGPGSQDLFATDVPTPAALVIGSEGSGLTPNIRKRCQLIVSIPMGGRVESLNATTAGAIALFDLVRRAQTEEPA